VPEVFACVFIALYVGHHVGDHWIQTGWQAAYKAYRSWSGRRACAMHVITLSLTKALFLRMVDVVVGLHLSWKWVALAFAVDAVSHYWADRRIPLKRLAKAVGRIDYWEKCTVVRKEKKEAAEIGPGTGSFHLDQSWHFFWIMVTSLIITATL